MDGMVLSDYPVADLNDRARPWTHDLKHKARQTEYGGGLAASYSQSTARARDLKHKARHRPYTDRWPVTFDRHKQTADLKLAISSTENGNAHTQTTGLGPMTSSTERGGLPFTGAAASHSQSTARGPRPQAQTAGLGPATSSTERGNGHTQTTDLGLATSSTDRGDLQFTEHGGGLATSSTERRGLPFTEHSGGLAASSTERGSLSSTEHRGLPFTETNSERSRRPYTDGRPRTCDLKHGALRPPIPQSLAASHSQNTVGDSRPQPQSVATHIHKAQHGDDDLKHRLPASSSRPRAQTPARARDLKHNAWRHYYTDRRPVARDRHTQTADLDLATSSTERGEDPRPPIHGARQGTGNPKHSGNLKHGAPASSTGGS
ncbi:hypothetical protein C8Q79DRAFT_1011105 [Trametes meyenii]|nr:hypothetical protein C8Q79DRAFT_1011102 [Trametes meyenii]KAI0644980.1 hypothetical protein C8Q79DRAFT_1011105 [Trametes meyenii]